MESLVRSVGMFFLTPLIFSSVATAVFSQEVSFSEEQVSQGKQLYDINCATCHGVNLEGAAVIPSLAGSASVSITIRSIILSIWPHVVDMERSISPASHMILQSPSANSLLTTKMTWPSKLPREEITSIFSWSGRFKC